MPFAATELETQVSGWQVIRRVGRYNHIQFSPISVITLNAYIKLTEKYSDHSCHIFALPP